MALMIDVAGRRTRYRYPHAPPARRPAPGPWHMATPIAKMEPDEGVVPSSFRDVTTWEILRYARFLVCEDESKSSVTFTARNEQKWKYIAPASKDGLKLCINRGHLLLTNDDIILENYFLQDMRSTMRGFVRGDSLLFVIKVKNEARKFRVRFARGPNLSAVTTCEDCAAKLSYFFPVRPYDPVDRPRPPHPIAEKDVLNGEVSAKEVSQVVRGNCSNVELPIPYSASAMNMEPDDLQKVLRLFLMETSFPSFVEAVEKQLDCITKDDEE